MGSAVTCQPGRRLGIDGPSAATGAHPACSFQSDHTQQYLSCQGMQHAQGRDWRKTQQQETLEPHSWQRSDCGVIRGQPKPRWKNPGAVFYTTGHQLHSQRAPCSKHSRGPTNTGTESSKAGYRGLKKHDTKSGHCSCPGCVRGRAGQLGVQG